MYPYASRQVYRRVPVSIIEHIFAVADLLDGRYVCVGYFCGCVNMCAFSGGVHSAVENGDTPAHPYINCWMKQGPKYIVLPAICVGCYGCSRRVLSLSRDCGVSTRNGDRVELDMLTEAAVQVLNGRTIHFLGR